MNEEAIMDNNENLKRLNEHLTELRRLYARAKENKETKLAFEIIKEIRNAEVEVRDSLNDLIKPGTPLELGACGSNPGGDQLYGSVMTWRADVHPDFTVNFQCMIDGEWKTIISLPPSNAISFNPVPMWAIEKASQIRIMNEVKE